MHLSTIPFTLTLASLLLPFAVGNPTGLTDLTEAPAPAQYCCNCESCDNCDASCPDPGCGLFVSLPLVYSTPQSRDGFSLMLVAGMLLRD